MMREQEVTNDSTMSRGEKDVETIPQTKPPSPPPPPNGGLQAWLQVMGGFMLFFNTWGLLNTFGVFQTYYETGALFHNSSSDIAWIGALQSFMLMFVGFITGPIYDKGYFRHLIVVGSFLIVFGLMMLSLCKSYWEVLLAQGFCIGIGAGCLYVPCIAILPTYFTTKLGLALGLAVSGSSLGGIIYPIVLYRLVGRIGFPWSVRVLGFIALITLLCPITFMKMRSKPHKVRSLIDWSAFLDPYWLAFTFGTLISMIGLFVCVVYISFFASDTKITDSSMSFYLVPIFNAASCFGRTIPNILADKIGPFNVITPGVTVVGILTFGMIGVTSQASIIVLAVLLGFFSGVCIATPPLCFVALTEDKSKIGTRMGMGFGIIAFGFLVGGPGGGDILGENDPLNWHGLWILGGVTTCMAGVIYWGLRTFKYGAKLNVKA